jgi:hypothetical protein
MASNHCLPQPAVTATVVFPTCLALQLLASIMSSSSNSIMIHQTHL